MFVLYFVYNPFGSAQSRENIAFNIPSSIIVFEKEGGYLNTLNLNIYITSNGIRLINIIFFKIKYETIIRTELKLK